MDAIAERGVLPDRSLDPIPLDLVPEVPAAMSSLDLGVLVPESLCSFVGRNDTWAGRTTGGRRVFVKRLTGSGPDLGDRFERSMAFERIVASEPFRCLRSPGLIGAERDSGVLVFDEVTNAVPGTGLLKDDLFDEGLARRAGQAIGELHSRPGTASRRDRTGARRASALIHDLHIDEYARSSGASLEVWGLLQHDKQLRSALDRLTRLSDAVQPVPGHGDLRLDQFLLADTQLYLVDWEEFRLDDPALDVGTFAGEWLLQAASGMFADAVEELGAPPGEIHEAFVAKGQRGLAEARPLIAAFWSGYREERGSVDPGMAARATAYAGLHLFDRTFATAMFSAKLRALHRGIAGVGRNALINAEQFVETIGLGEE